MKPAPALRARRALLAALLLTSIAACQPRRSAREVPPSGTQTPSSALPAPAVVDTHAVATLVRQLGERLQRVSLLAPHDDLVAAIRREYGELVSPALLERWIHDPTSAPGRVTSSPWPDHIDVGLIVPRPGGSFAVRGWVVERTSADAAQGVEPLRVPVQLMVMSVDGRLQIVAYRGRHNERT